MSTDTTAKDIIDISVAACEPHVLGEDGERFYAVTTPAGATVQVIDLEKNLDAYRDRPRRKSGTYTVHDVPSFATYFEKHSLTETEVWGDVLAQTLCAVLNAHTTDPDAGHEDHRLTYAVKKTDAWKAWTAIDGQLLDQVAFAEHIEARAIDFVDPTSAQMLEIAQTFEAKTNVEFQSGQILASGERKLTYKETVNAKAGETGHVEIPKEIALQLVPFEGAAAYKVIARFRYRITNGRLLLGVVLERPEDIIREAFLDVVDSVETAIQHVVLRGSGVAR